jgi:hypothetical protein
MCITLSNDVISNKPFNESKSRWKVLKDNGGALSSVHRFGGWKINVNKVAKDDTFNKCAQKKDVGIHVFLSKKDAVYAAKGIMEKALDVEETDKLVVVEVEVSSFNVSGVWNCLERPLNNETWKKAKVVKVFTASGRYDITHRFA